MIATPHSLPLALAAAAVLALPATAPAAAAPAGPPLQQPPSATRGDSAEAASSPTGAAGKQKGKQDDAAPGAPRRTGPLFESDAPLRLTLTADFGAVFKSRDTLRRQPRPARLAVVEPAAAAGTSAAIPVILTTRGHFRLKSTTCSFAPLRVAFDSGGTKGTPFAGQRALKLSTHCRSGSREYEQNVLREYLAYRVFNLITDRSFRARLAKFTYAEARDSTKGVTAWGFFVESERELGRRLGARLLEARGGRFDDFEPAQTDLMSVFQYMIGNTDFSIWALHNVRIFAPGSGASLYYPVPYDFDWSGVVSARYAFPDARLGTRTVHERVYRGPCRTAEQLAPTFAHFVAKRDSITALYRSLPDLDPRYVRETEEYFAEFYATIGDARRWKAHAASTCRDEGQ